MQTIDQITDAKINSILEGIDTPEGVHLEGRIYVDHDQVTSLANLSDDERADAETLQVRVDVTYEHDSDADEEIVETACDAVQAAIPAGWYPDSGCLDTHLRPDLSDRPVAGFWAAWDYSL